MDISQLQSPPFPAELRMGEGPDNVLHLLLDRDVVNEDFLFKMDQSARRIFNATVSSVRLAIEQRKQLPDMDVPQVNRKTRGASKAKATKTIAKAKSTESPDDVLAGLQKLIPSEDESWSLAQAAECTYMSETLARVILEWDLVNKGQPVPITAQRDFDCCKEQSSDCRHPSDYLRTRSRDLLRRLFQFCLFEAVIVEKKA